MRHIYITLLLMTICLSACAELTKKETTDSDSITVANRISKMPDFSHYTDVKEKKNAFFNFLRPMVREENAKLLRDRKLIVSLFTKHNNNEKISTESINWLQQVASKFRMKTFNYTEKEDQTILLSKIDIIPEALFLAQAANESAWGTSRFAKTANNLFGQWCFSKGCGIVPAQRGANETHEVQKFTTVNDAVASYVHNLNSHPAYQKLRDTRTSLRDSGKTPSGYVLAVGLEKYSARGLEYVKEIRSMITFNKLEAILD